MTPEHGLTLIIETIRAIRIGAPVSKGGVTLLLEPWPDLYWNAMGREGAGWINLLQAAAAGPRPRSIGATTPFHKGLPVRRAHRPRDLHAGQ